MDIKRTDLPKSQVKLVIEASADKIASFRKQALDKISAQANIPGFRKGHIPEKVLIEKYGEELILAETADTAVPRLLAEAIVNENLSPIDRPQVELESIDPFRFTAIVTVLPEIKLGKWEEVKIPKKKLTIAKKEIDEVIDNLRDRFKERKPVDRASQKGDFVEVDFAGKTPDGVPLDGTQSKMHPIILGDGNFIPGFEEAIIGMKKGEDKTFPVTFPQDYHAQHMAGKEVHFDITVHSVQEQIQPEVDEAFAKQIFGKEMSPDELRAEIEKILLEKAEEDERQRRESELIEAWAKDAKCEIPDIIVDEEINNMIGFMQQQMEQTGMSWEKHLENLKKTDEEVRKEMRPEAEKRAKQRLVLGKVLAEAKPEVSETDIDAAIAEHNHHSGHSHGTDDADYRERTGNMLRLKKLFAQFLGEEQKAEAANTDSKASGPATNEDESK